MAFDAVSFRGFSSCSCSIAFRPMGVAALSSPSMFAAMFMNMVPITGWSFGTSGNSFVSTGLSHLASLPTAPFRSPIFITPIHSDSTPVSPMEISKAVLADENVASIMAGNTVVSPVNTSFAAAITNATIKNAIQI